MNEEHNNLREYTEYFANQLPPINFAGLYKKLEEASITVASPPFRDGKHSRLRKSSKGDMHIKDIKVSSRGALVTYLIEVGCLRLSINILHVNCRAPRNNMQVIYSRANTEIILMRSAEGKEMVIKRIRFTKKTVLLKGKVEGEHWTIPSHFEAVRSLLFEVAFGKICAALGIAVKVGSPDHKFDLVCYGDHVQFYMERCKPLRHIATYIPIEDAEKRLKYCVSVMHHFNLIHKDIKPDNVMINSERELVLVDFDISTAIHEKPGELSDTYREGTRGYMSPQMKSIVDGCIGKVDLYHNDMWSLKQVVHFMERGDQQEIPNIPVCQQHVEPTELEGNIASLSRLIFNKEQAGQQVSVVDQLWSSPFANYFREIRGNVDQLDYDSTLLVKSLGLSRQLVKYFQLKPKLTLQQAKLLDKMNKDLSRYLEDSRFDTFELYELRRAYTRQLKILELGVSLREQQDIAVQLAFALVKRLQDRAFQYDEMEEILDQIKNYIETEEQRGEYYLLKLNTKLMKQRPNLSRVQEYLKYIPINSPKLITGAYFSFLKGHDEICWALLCKYQPPKSKYYGKSCLYQLARHIEDILGEETTRSSEFLFGNTFLLYNSVSLQLGRTAQNLITTNDLPSPIKFFYLYNKGVAAIETDDFVNAYQHFTEASDILNSLTSKQRSLSVWTDLSRCCCLLHFGKLEQVQAIATNVIEGSQDESQRASAYQLLAKVDMKLRRFEDCLRNLMKAIQAANGASGQHQSFHFLTGSLCDILSNLASMDQFHDKIIVAAATISKFVTAELALPEEHKTHSYCFRALSCIYDGMGLSAESQKCEQQATVARTYAVRETSYYIANDLLKFVNHYYHSGNPSKVVSYTVLLDSFLRRFAHHFSKHRLMLTVKSLIFLKIAETGEIVDRWLKFMIKVINTDETGGPEVVQIQEEIGRILTIDKDYQQSYQIVKSCVYLNGIGTYIAGICLINLGRTSEGVCLLETYVQHNTMESDKYLTRLFTFQSHRLLCRIHPNDLNRKLHLAEALRCMNQLRCDSLLDQVNVLPAVAELCLETGNKREFIRNKVRLYKISQRHFKLQFKQQAVGEVGRLAYLNGEYTFAIECLKQLPFARSDGNSTLKRLALSYLHRRKLRAFYKVTGYLLARTAQGFPKSLKARLKKLKQTVKYYVLFGGQPSSSIQLVLKNSMQYVEDNYSSMMTEAKLKDLALLKTTLRHKLCFKCFKRDSKSDSKTILGVIHSLRRNIDDQ